MNQKEYIEAINGANINGLTVGEELTVKQMDFILKGINSVDKINGLKDNVKEAKKKLSEAEDLVAEQIEYIEELNATTKVTKLIVSHGSDKYEVQGNPDRVVTVGGKDRKLEELKTDKAFVSQLVKMKTPLLVKLKKEA